MPPGTANVIAFTASTAIGIITIVYFGGLTYG